MHFFFDESGDFAFGDTYDCYVQAALICPDSRLSAIGEFVETKSNELRVDEIHGVDLTDEQLNEVAVFIGSTDTQLLVHVTDTVIVTQDAIAQFRLDQAAKLRENLDWYRRESTKAVGSPSPSIERWMLRQIKRSGLQSQIANGDFIQANYLIELIADALQKALYCYFADQWRDDFFDLFFVLDGKQPNKLAAGEKYLNDSIVPVLGSRPHKGLSTVSTWKKEPRHPFDKKFGLKRGRIKGQDVEGAIDLNLLFEHGLSFESSEDHPGLQLVDVVAHVTRRAVLEPANAQIQAAYDAVRPKLRNEDGRCLTIHRLRGAYEDRSSLERYRPLYGLERAA